MIRTELDVNFFWFWMLETSYAASEIQVHVLHLHNLGTSGTGFEKKAIPQVLALSASTVKHFFLGNY